MEILMLNAVNWAKFERAGLGYKVLAPERATLEIMKESDGWQIAQLKLSCNAPPSKKTAEKVYQWISTQDQMQT